MGKAEDTSFDEEIRIPYLGNKSVRINDHLRNVIATHFDPETGSKFWLKKEKELNLDARKDITDFEDLKSHLSLKEGGLREFEDALRYLPIRDLVPKSQQKNIYVVGETGGTTGVAKRAAFAKEYWDNILAFLNYALDLHAIPKEGDLLFIGPTGPHAFGFFAMGIAKSWNSLFFTIDLDTRIIKNYIAEGMTGCLQRYMKHILEQSRPILKSQDIGVLITTSKILEVLHQHVNLAEGGIKGILHAGTPLDPDTYKIFKEEIYVDTEGRSIPLIGIYGNGHSGLHVENFSSASGSYDINYYSQWPYVITELVDINTGMLVDYGERGQVFWYRLTPEYLIPGMPERDEATRIKPSYPYEWDGVQNVDILKTERESIIEGVY